MYVVYLTTYSGDKFPSFYIGSSTLERVESGYHGSVRSQKYRALWEGELKDNPHLFQTAIVSIHENRNESLIAEEALQRFHNAVKSPCYVNMAYARGGFINPGKWSDETRAKMSESAKNRGKPKTKKARILLGPEEQKRRATIKRQAKAEQKRLLNPKIPKAPKKYVPREEINARISKALQGHELSKEAKEKIGKKAKLANTGRKQSPEHVAARAASRKKTMNERKENI